MSRSAATYLPPETRRRRRHLAMAVALLALGLNAAQAAQAAPADCSRIADFDIPAQPLNQALLAFARQAGVSVLFPGEDYQHLSASALRGTHCVEEALRLLLADSGVEGHISDAGQLILDRPQIAAEDESAETGSDRSSGEAERGEGLVASLLNTLFGAQPPSDAPVESAFFREDRIEEIMVTGSRIERSGMHTQTPVTVLRSDDIDMLAPGGLVEALDLLPQFMANSGPRTVGSATGPLGASFLNLRGLGANRTLVLLDGRRVAPSNRLGTPDIATLPEALIAGVEIVTGGASAAYGSDAVSGVVNHVLDTSFTGLKGQIQGGLTARGDNGRFEWSLALGRNLGNGMHLLAAVDHSEAEKVESYADRDWFRNWGTVDLNGDEGPLVVAPDVRSRLYTAGGLIRLPGSELDMIHFLEGGSAAPFEDGSLVGATRQSGGTGFLEGVASKEEDQSGQGSLYPDTERGSLFLYLDKDFNSGWNAFAQFLHGHNLIDYVAPGAHQELDAWHATIYRDNAFLPPAIAAVMDDEGLESFPLYRYSSSRDLARARGRQENDSSSYTFGFSGQAGELQVGGFYQFSRSESIYSAIDFPRLDRLYRAMDTVRDPVSGAALCRSTLSFPGDGCVPANPFGAGTMSAAAVDWILEGDMYRASELDQQHAELTLDTEFLSRRAAGPVAIAAGLSWREESFYQYNGPDDMVALEVPPAAEAGYRGLPATFEGPYVLQFSGVGDEPLWGGFRVWELFGETVVPLVRRRGILDAVDLGVAWRMADYSGSGLVQAWKTSLDWRLSDALRFRLTRSRDTRAATLAERYDRTGGGGSAYDPELGRSYTFSRLAGGNPEVDPELADTWTAGLVWQPDFADNLSLSLDWYELRIKDYITQLGVQSIVNGCHGELPELCERIIRDGESGEIDIVQDFYLNVARAEVRGTDLELAWQRPVSWFSRDGESVALRVFASYMGENSFGTLGSRPLHFEGTTSLPEWTATGMLSYRRDRFRGTLTGRYIPDRVQFNEPVPERARLDDNGVDATWYLNLRFDLRLGEAGGPEQLLYLDIANLLDRDPPVVASWSDFFGASAFVPWLHDPLGRRFTLGMKIEF